MQRGFCCGKERNLVTFMAFLNNAAKAQQKPESVKNAPPASEARAKELTARLFHMKNPGNVIFTRNGTRAVELALRAFIKKGDHIILSVMDVDATWELAEELAAVQGVEVSMLGANVYGVLNYEEIESLIRPNTRAIVCAHGCSVTGNIADMDRLTTIARRHKLLVISDGCQTAGAADVRLEDLGIDVYCFTGYKKLMGPRGIGGICLKEGLMQQFEEGLKPVLEEKPELAQALEPVDPAKLGSYCAAIEFILEKGIYGISMLPHRLAKRFFEATKSMDAVEVYGDFGTNTKLATVSIRVDGFTPEQVHEHMLMKFGIVCKPGLHNASRMHEALGTAEQGLTRFSFGYFNNRMEVNDTIWALMDLLGLDDLYLLA